MGGFPKGTANRHSRAEKKKKFLKSQKAAAAAPRTPLKFPPDFFFKLTRRRKFLRTKETEGRANIFSMTSPWPPWAYPEVGHFTF